MLYRKCTFCPYLNYQYYNSYFRRYLPHYNRIASIETKRIEERKDYIIEHLKIPVINLQNKDVQEEINNEIENDIMEFKNQMEYSAKEEYAEAQGEGREFEPYIISTVYEKTYDEDDIISISIIYHEYINGANYYIRTTYNYDINTGKSLSLGDLFKDGVDYIALLNQAVRSYIKRNPEKYSPEAIEEFEGIKEDQPFFLDGNNIAMFFGFHQIAPTSAEIPIIRIPFTEFSGSIKPKFLD